MLVWLAEHLVKYYSGFNVFSYLTFRAIVSLLTALFISLWMGPRMIARLQKLSFGQVVRNDGPESHFSKRGTPTMGGIMILTAITVSVLLWAYPSNPYVWCVLTVLIGPGVGRFAGALLLGLAIGSMVALAQAIVREAWLEIQYGPHEIAEVSLGATPVTLGSDPEATIHVAGVAPFAARYELSPAGVIWTDPATKRSSTVPLGAKRQVGDASVTVRGIAQRLVPAFPKVAPMPPRPATIVLPPPPPPPRPRPVGIVIRRAPCRRAMRH